MYKTHFFFYLFVMLLFVSFFACNDNYEDYSTNPNDLIVFSRDTVRFDTVLTTVNSPVQFLMIYNRNDKPLLISSVELENGETSGFKINVDGMTGKSFENVALRSKDSLYIMIDVKPEMNGEVVPTLLSDRILFATNGVQQKVILEAYGQDVHIWEGVIISSDTLIQKSKPYLIRDSLLVEENATLSIEEGVCFYMEDNARVLVKGNLKIKGSLEDPVVFRGKRTDYMLNIPYDLIPGQWDGFYFDGNSFGNEIEYAHIRNGQGGLVFEVSNPEEEKIRLKNVILTNFSEYLIHAINCNITAENCEFTNSRYALLYLVGGKYSFTHCTMANYMPSIPERGWANSDNETIILYNADSTWTKNPIYYPLIQANFVNTIIWGNRVSHGNYRGRSDIQLFSEDEVEFNYFFRNCIVPAYNGQNGEHAVDCVFNKDPRFEWTDTEEPKTGYFLPVFNFRLKNPADSPDTSPAINTADPDYSIDLPFDLDGKDRLADEHPDMGAYEN